MVSSSLVWWAVRWWSEARENCKVKSSLWISFGSRKLFVVNYATLIRVRLSECFNYCWYRIFFWVSYGMSELEDEYGVKWTEISILIGNRKKVERFKKCKKVCRTLESSSIWYWREFSPNQFVEKKQVQIDLNLVEIVYNDSS